MVGAISDIQLWCLRPLVELGRPLRLCMVMHVLRKIFMLWVTLIFCGVNYLYKTKRTLERRNHTTKTKLDASDYHILGCYLHSDYAPIAGMHVKSRHGLGDRNGDWNPSRISVRNPKHGRQGPCGKRKKSPYCAPWPVHRGKLQDKVSSNQDATIDEPFAPRAPILRGWVLEDLVHRPYHCCLHLKMSLIPVVQRHTVSS